MALSTGNSAFCFAVALVACLAQPAFALDPRYPDWPCQQLKVPGISVASVWTGPSIEGIDKAEPSTPGNQKSSRVWPPAAPRWRMRES